jgi:hypothetical protein
MVEGKPRDRQPARERIRFRSWTANDVATAGIGQQSSCAGTLGACFPRKLPVVNDGSNLVNPSEVGRERRPQRRLMSARMPKMSFAFQRRSI